MTPQLRLPVYDPEVVNAFWRTHSHQESGQTFINGNHVRADGGNTVKRFLLKRSESVRERTLERNLLKYGFTLTHFEDWARDNYDGWSGRWIPRWEKEIDEVA